MGSGLGLGLGDLGLGDGLDNLRKWKNIPQTNNKSVGCCIWLRIENPEYENVSTLPVWLVTPNINPSLKFFVGLFSVGASGL